ncbi:DNA translocase FtsK, partial [Acinetobacter baumannii]
TLKAMPGYLQDLFYKNVSPNESAYDLTTQPANKAATVKVAEMPKAEEVTDEVELNAQPEKAQSKASSTRHDEIAERLFADVLAKEQQSQPETIEEKLTPQPENFERTLE